MRSRDWIQFALLSIAWGTSFLFIKIALTDLSPLMVGWLRLAIASLTLWTVALIARLRPRFSRRAWLTLAAMGFFNNSLAFVLIPWGEQYIDSGLAAILNSTVPLFTIVLAHLFLHDERLSTRRLGGLVLGFAGVVVLMAPPIIASGGDWLTATSVQGGLAVILASACYAIATVIGRRFLRGEPAVLTAATQLTFGMLWLLPLVLLTGSLGSIAAMSLPTWGAMLWLGVIGSGFAYLLYFSLLRNVGATQVVVVTYMLPLIAVALGVLLLGEQLTWTMLAGLALILGGLIMVNGLPFRRALAPVPQN